MCGDQCFSINFGNVSHDMTGKLLNGRSESIMFKLCSVQEFLYTYRLDILYSSISTLIVLLERSFYSMFNSPNILAIC